ncbi:hypothetical protein [Peribacillus simplex]|uniref:hypothetical protein n=1 Tax=Peribacillus simplex TaxID=1478 RepID=UPI000A78CED9|nr:hypothetical protein [Peribacillus simplex]
METRLVVDSLQDRPHLNGILTTLEVGQKEAEKGLSGGMKRKPNIALGTCP